jgi:hypothetical protein
MKQRIAGKSAKMRRCLCKGVKVWDVEICKDVEDQFIREEGECVSGGH